MNAELLIKRLLVFVFDLKRTVMLRRKVSKMLSHLASTMKVVKPTDILLRKYKSLWSKYSVSAGTAWLSLYGNTSGIWDYRYVPEDIYYNQIEPRLNNKIFSKAYTDKNFYSEILSGFSIPGTIACNTEGVLYDSSGSTITLSELSGILLNHKCFILKPAVDSGGGRSVTKWVRQDKIFLSNEGNTFSEEYLKAKYDRNYLIQDIIESHTFYTQFNTSSLNTVRVMTYRSVSDEAIHVLHAVLRVGSKGSITDNQASGGYACSITNDGKLTGFAVDKKGTRYREVNGIALDPGTPVEGYDSIIKVAHDIAHVYRYSRLLGLDLCIDKEGAVRVIEVNSLNNEINFFQLLSGPLFGQFTEEVVQYCSTNRRSFVIDFEI